MNAHEFRNPSAAYRTAPFWAWNGALSPDETRRQVRDMAAHGMGGGFMHSRVGLITEYLSDDWFANCAASVEEGKRAGFLSWIYDEDRWPSGSCGGRTAAAHPDFRCRTLVMERAGEWIGWGNDFGASGAADCEKTLLGRFRVRASRRAPLRYERADARAGRNAAAFYEVVLPSCGWENGGHYPDLLNPDAVREFLRNTHEVYARRLGAEFGKAIPGLFTDEPATYSRLPWSVGLPEAFRARRGYDLLDRLPALFLPAADAPQVRHDYWKTVQELYNEHFVQQIARWCDAHGLQFTGHFLCEQDLYTQCAAAGGGVMLHYVPMSLPGIDLLVERIIEVVTVKQASSICRQFGKPRMLSETYGCTGYDFTFEGQKWIGDWQMALGVNLVCQHLALYTMKGCAKRDYPPSYGEQSPWWRHFRHMADYQARLSFALSRGAPVRDLLVIHPLTSAWCTFDPKDPPARPWSDKTEQFQTLLGHLLSLHRDFDLGDETVLADAARVEDGALIVGQARYRLVIVPVVENLESSTADLLERFAAAGGHILWLFGRPVSENGAMRRVMPAWVDGRPSDRLRRLIAHPRVHAATAHRADLEEILDRLLPPRVSLRSVETGLEASRVIVQERETPNGRLFFLANTDREAGLRARLRVPARGRWERWDCETGDVHPVPSREDAHGSDVDLELAPVGSLLLRLDPAQPRVTDAPPAPRVCGETLLTPPDGWPFARCAPNSLVLDRCSWRLNRGAFSEEMFLPDAQELWRKRLGLFPARNMSREEQPYIRLRDPNALKSVARVTLRYRFQIARLPETEVFLVLEDRARTDLSVNGRAVSAPAEGWFMDRSFEKVPVGRFLKPGPNVIELAADIAPLRVMEDIYLVGDFGVDADSLALIAEPDRLQPGDWTRQGYPFYTDGMMYQAVLQRAEGDCRRVEIVLERFAGTVAAVWANGVKAGVLGWRPYRADVTRHLRPGANDLAVEIVGSPRNLMGPRHSTERYPWVIGSWDLEETSYPGYHLSPAGLTGGVKAVFLDP